MENDELERLFEAMAEEKHELLRLRDFAILHTLFSTGLRVSEAGYLGLDRLIWTGGNLRCAVKAVSSAWFFCATKRPKTIKKYLAKRKDNSKALFIGQLL